MEDILLKVRELVAKELKKPLDKVTPDSNIADDLGADSIDRMELCFSIEENFAVMISDEQLENLHTPADIAALVKTLQEKD